MRFLIFGAPGAGKGTQAARIASRYGVPHLSTGDILRATVAAGGELSDRIRPIMDSGELVADKLMLAVVKARLSMSDCRRGFVFDGFPRTRDQALGLEAMLSELGWRIDLMILLTLEPSELMDRLAHRAAQADNQRSDDDPVVAAHRLEVYKASSGSLIAYYRDRGILHPVSGLGSMDEVSGRLFAFLDPIAEQHQRVIETQPDLIKKKKKKKRKKLLSKKKSSDTDQLESSVASESDSV